MPPALCGGIWGPLTSGRPKSNPVGPWEATTPHTCDPALPRRGAVGAGCCLWCPPPRPQRLDVPQRCQSPPRPHREVNRLPGGGWRGEGQRAAVLGPPSPPGSPLAVGALWLRGCLASTRNGSCSNADAVALTAGSASKQRRMKALASSDMEPGTSGCALNMPTCRMGCTGTATRGKAFQGPPPQPPSLWVP